MKSTKNNTKAAKKNIKPLTKPFEPKFTVGTRMAKYFFDGEQDRPYGGKVTAFDSKKRLYSVLYDDGDVEKMSEEELGKLVVTPTQQDSSLMPLFRVPFTVYY